MVFDMQRMQSLPWARIRVEAAVIEHPASGLDGIDKRTCVTLQNFGCQSSLAEARVSRTHRRPLRTTTGFEDREDHRSLSTSAR